MKTKFLLPKTIVLLIFLPIIIFACKKETSQNNLSNEEEEQAAIATSRSEAESEIIFNEVFDNVIGVNNEEGLSGTGIFGRIATSPSAETARITGCYEVS